MFSESPVGVGDIATYICDDGFVLDGSEVVTCDCNSEWSGVISSCVSNKESNKTIFIGVAVAIAGLVLIATAVIIIIVLACLMKRMKRKKVVVTENVAYLSNTHSSSLKSNAADIATSDLSPPMHTNTNEAYSLLTSANEAYGIAATTANEGNDIATYSNDSYVATDVPTAPNQAYQTAKYSSDRNPLTYDYAYNYIPHST